MLILVLISSLEIRLSNNVRRISRNAVYVEIRRCKDGVRKFVEV
jgi:hypothetical protein